MSNLPSICADHPKAQVRHEWDQKHYVLNGYPAGTGIKGNHQYFCSVCGRELCSPEEFDRRKTAATADTPTPEGGDA